MEKQIHIRDMNISDLPAVKQIIDDNEMFPSEYLDAMAEGYLQQTSEER